MAWIGSGRARSSEDRKVGGGRRAGKGIEMAQHPGPLRASTVRVEHDHLRSPGAALAEERRQVARGLEPLDVAEGLASGQAERRGADGDAVNPRLEVQQLIGVLGAAVAEQERVAAGAAQEFIIAGATVDYVVCCGALNAVGSAVAVDDGHGL